MLITLPNPIFIGFLTHTENKYWLNY